MRPGIAPIHAQAMPGINLHLRDHRVVAGGSDVGESEHGKVTDVVAITGNGIGNARGAEELILKVGIVQNRLLESPGAYESNLQQRPETQLLLHAAIELHAVGRGVVLQVEGINGSRAAGRLELGKIEEAVLCCGIQTAIAQAALAEQILDAS